jgi:hypothetical protein
MFGGRLAAEQEAKQYMISEAGSRPNPAIAILAVGCTILAGCGSSARVTATGMVTFDGQPVHTGVIIFQPLEREAAPQGTLVNAGRYTIQCRPGRHRVQIRGTKLVDESRVPRSMPRLASAAIYEDYIPASYNTASTLEVDCVAGHSNVFDFQLTSSPDR